MKALDMKSKTDPYRIDGHKLHYHVARVNDWLAGKNIYPIYMEVSPSGTCNHRCVFCALDFMGYERHFLRTEIFRERLEEMGRLGLKSVMYAGEGEPFLHRDLPELIRHTKYAGMDVAVTTNGVLMNRAVLEQILGVTEWIRVSCNAGTSETYARIHRTRPDDFSRVFENLGQAVRIKEANRHHCTLGLQILLLPETVRELEGLTERASDMGLDYILIKPYSQHPKSHTKTYQGVSYGRYLDLAEKLERFQTDRFSVIVRLRTMQQWDEKTHRYDKCLAMPFWSYLDARGNIWGCSVYLNDQRFHYGNIYDAPFQQIWEGEKRRQSLQWVDRNVDVAACRINCRMDEINTYLWELTHPPAHVNFI